MNEKKKLEKRKKSKNSLSLSSHLVPRRPGPAVEQHRDRRRPPLLLLSPVLLPLLLLLAVAVSFRGKPYVGDLALPRAVPHPFDEPAFPLRPPPLREGPEGEGYEGDLARELLCEEPGVPCSGGEAGGEVGAVANFGLRFFFFSRSRFKEIEGRSNDRGRPKSFLLLCSSSLSPFRP